MNNRQARGRGRGRNNNNNRNNNNRGGGGIDRDNRIDNRARGNAAQMLDKYKKMAHDAQVNDDRVNAEYYLQFADHYFRVNADSQARREEQRIAREESRGNNNSNNSNNNDDRDSNSDDGNSNERKGRQPRERGQREPHQNNRRPQNDDRNDAVASEAGDQAEASEEKKPTRTRRPRKTVDNPVASKSNDDAGDANGLDASALPPAISISDDAPEVEKKPVRKKRVVKPKAVEVEAADEGDAA